VAVELPVETIEELPDAAIVNAVSDRKEVTKTLRWQHIVLVAVAGWLMLWATVLALQSLKFRWRMRQLTDAAPSHRQLLASICRGWNIKRKVRLFNSSQFEEPVAFGMLRWTILLPAQVESRLNREELTALLCHELAHLTRGDIFWLNCGRLLTSCFAFQPMNFVARRRWQEHAEFQCDDWAVEGNTDRLTLARSLTLVAEWQAKRQVCAGVVSAGGERFHITNRVERLVADAKPDQWQRRPRRIAVFGAGVIAIVALVVLSPQTQGVEPIKPTVDAATLATSPKLAESKSELVEVSKSIVDESDIGELLGAVNGLHTDIQSLLNDLEQLQPVLDELAKDPIVAAKVEKLRRRVQQLTSNSENIA